MINACGIFSSPLQMSLLLIFIIVISGRFVLLAERLKAHLNPYQFSTILPRLQPVFPASGPYPKRHSLRFLQRVVYQHCQWLPNDTTGKTTPTIHQIFGLRFPEVDDFSKLNDSGESSENIMWDPIVGTGAGQQPQTSQQAERCNHH